MKLSIFLSTLILLATLLGCQMNNADKQALSRLSDSVSFTGLSGNDVKLVTTASLKLKMKDVEKGANSLADLTRNYGGMVYQKNVLSSEIDRKELKLSDDSLLLITTYSPAADMVVRVPASQVVSFLKEASDLDIYTESNMLNVDDQSLVYLENSLKQEAREEALTTSVKQKKRDTSIGQRLALTDELVDKTIANARINGEAKFSNITLQLYQDTWVRREKIPAYNLDAYQLPFASRVGNSLATGWAFFQNFMLVMASLWVFILAGLMGYVAFRFWKRPVKVSAH